jgi:RNA polymerase sigma-70 factor (ECF subfamily)
MPRSTAPEDLLRAIARDRDRSAFADLFTSFAPRIKGYLMARRTDAALAEEVAQEVMHIVWLKAALFDPERGTAGAWIFTIARNALLKAIRGTHYPVPHRDDPVMFDETAQPADQALVTAEDHRAVGAAMRGLPVEQRETLQSVYVGGRTLREVAEEQNLPLGTVKTRVRLALERLRNRLLPEGDK